MSRMHAEAVLEGIGDAVIHVDDALVCTYANAAAGRLSGRSSKDVVGRPLDECLPPSLHATLDGAVSRALRQRSEKHFHVLDPASETWYACRLAPSDQGLTVFLRAVAVPPAESESDVAEDTLEMSRRQYLTLIDTSPQIVWTIMTTGAVVYLNEPGRTYFGIDEQEEPFGWASRIHPDDRHVLHERWRSALESGGLFEMELRLLRHDGEYLWHLSRGLPVRDEEEVITHWCGTSTDIDDLVRTRKDFEERELLFRTMADAAPVLIWMTDETRAYTYFNRGYLDFTRRSLEEALAAGMTPDVHPDDVDRYLSTISSAFEAPRPFKLEYRLRHHDGFFRWILDHGAPLFNADGEFTGFIGSCIDIEDRKRLEVQARFLAESSAILTSSLDYESTLRTVAGLMVPRMADWCVIDMVDEVQGTALLAVAHADPAKSDFARALRERYPVRMDAQLGVANVLRTGKAELYPDVTDEMLERSGRDNEYLNIVRRVGFKSALIVPLEARDQILGAMTLAWAESERRYSEADLRFAEELARRAAIVVDNARLYRHAGDARKELEALNATLEVRVNERTQALVRANENSRREIDERKHAQQALARANALLEHRNRELQDFAYVASHDLQEPLRKILSFAGLLSSEYGSRIEGGMEYLERIENAAARMMGLIQDLLAFSRIATTGTAFRKVRLDEIVGDVLIDLEVRIAETGGKVRIGRLCEVEADPLQMHQLFLNLIANGLKFHRDDAPPVVSVTARPDDSVCEVEVRDNGIGFEEKYADRIFAPFQRLHGRGSYQGTGMGLAICRRIVERHDGSISARSTPGEGSVFTVRLPVTHDIPSSADLSSGRSGSVAASGAEPPSA